MKQRAFTLIELLVVIAIIAILAAILFPVFAQAKAAAKKAASISNIKQASLAGLMYSGDYDDVFVLDIAWDGNGAPTTFAGAPFQPWTWLQLPYQKNSDIMQDPQAPPNEKWPGGFDQSTAKLLHPQYGYNHTWLSPLTGTTVATAVFAPMSQTALGSPAETVLLAAKFSSIEDNQAANDSYSYGAGSIVSMIQVDPPDCQSLTLQWCFDNWGVNGFFDATYLLRNEAAGARTGGVSLRAGNQAVVAWADGHASAKAAGVLAAGTNWTRTQNASAVVVTDPSKYVWDTK